LIVVIVIQQLLPSSHVNSTENDDSHPQSLDPSSVASWATNTITDSGDAAPIVTNPDALKSVCSAVGFATGLVSTLTGWYSQVNRVINVISNAASLVSSLIGFWALIAGNQLLGLIGVILSGISITAIVLDFSIEGKLLVEEKAVTLAFGVVGFGTSIYSMT
jgi:hypothetical protein